MYLGILARERYHWHRMKEGSGLPTPEAHLYAGLLVPGRFAERPHETVGREDDRPFSSAIDI
jgi:hypothetical protein